jgi:hypothetical protein
MSPVKTEHVTRRDSDATARARPPGGTLPPATAQLGDRELDLAVLAREICEYCHEHYPDDHRRDGPAGVLHSRGFAIARLAHNLRIAADRVESKAGELRRTMSGLLRRAALIVAHPPDSPTRRSRSTPTRVCQTDRCAPSASTPTPDVREQHACDPLVRPHPTLRIRGINAGNVS